MELPYQTTRKRLGFQIIIFLVKILLVTHSDNPNQSKYTLTNYVIACCGLSFLDRIFSIADSRSFCVIFIDLTDFSLLSTYLFIALIAALLHMSSISATLYPSVRSTNFAHSISLPSGFFLVCILNMFSRPLASGFDTSSILSNLPGLSNALSIRSALLVAPITKTLLSSSRPSISVKSCETTLSVTLESEPLMPLLGARESSSSRKIMHGAA